MINMLNIKEEIDKFSKYGYHIYSYNIDISDDRVIKICDDFSNINLENEKDAVLLIFKSHPFISKIVWYFMEYFEEIRTFKIEE